MTKRLCLISARNVRRKIRSQGEWVGFVASNRVTVPNLAGRGYSPVTFKDVNEMEEFCKKFLFSITFDKLGHRIVLYEEN